MIGLVGVTCKYGCVFLCVLTGQSKYIGASINKTNTSIALSVPHVI